MKNISGLAALQIALMLFLISVFIVQLRSERTKPAVMNIRSVESVVLAVFDQDRLRVPQSVSAPAAKSVVAPDL
ncbi:MAG: hypothetical protein AAF408_19265 [Pseudomonadota bacterium]